MHASADLLCELKERPEVAVARPVEFALDRLVPGQCRLVTVSILYLPFHLGWAFKSGRGEGVGRLTAPPWLLAPVPRDVGLDRVEPHRLQPLQTVLPVLRRHLLRRSEFF